MENHQVVLLSRLRQCFDHFNSENASSFVKFLIESGKSSTVLSGIFRQLYQEGNTNSIELLQSLLSKANKLVENQCRVTRAHDKTKGENDYFEWLPRSLMCEIGSYLSTKDILTKWNLVDRKFMQIGYQPETHTKWSFDMSQIQLEGYPPKFGITRLVSKLKTVEYHFKFDRLFALSNVKSAENIKLGLCLCCILICFFLFVSNFFCSLNISCYI